MDFSLDHLLPPSEINTNYFTCQQLKAFTSRFYIVISKTFKVHLWYQHPWFGIQTSPWCVHDRRWRWPASPPGWSCWERFRRPGQTSSRRALRRWPEIKIIYNIEPFQHKVCQLWLAKTFSFYDYFYQYNYRGCQLFKSFFYGDYFYDFYRRLFLPSPLLSEICNQVPFQALLYKYDKLLLSFG